jgi:hypothetical protein
LLLPYFNHYVGDDWSYIIALENLIQGELNYTGWTSMPLIGQLLLALPFSNIIENTLIASRVSSQTFMAIGMFTIGYLIPKQKYTLPLLLVFVLNPIMLSAYSFMTDMYFTISIVISILMLLKKRLLLSTLFFLLSLSIRDIAVVFVPFMMIISYNEVKDWKKALTYTSLLMLSYLLISIGFREYLFSSMGTLPFLYDDGRARLLDTLDKGIIGITLSAIKNLIIGFVFIGWSLFPLILIGKKSLSNRMAVSILIIFIAGISIGYILPENQFRDITQQTARFFGLLDYLQGNILNIWFTELNIYKLANGLIIGTGLCISSYTIAICFRYEILEFSGSCVKDLIISNSLLLATFTYILILSIAGIYVRYMLLPIFLIGYLYINDISKITIQSNTGKILYLTILIFGVHTFLVSKAYVNSKYARASLIEKAESMGAGPLNMDASFEYNAYHNYDPEFKSIVKDKWWWVIDDEYHINTYVQYGYTVIDSINIYTYLPPQTTLFLSKRDNMVITD